MHPGVWQGRLFAACWIAAWGLLSSALCVTSAQRIGATFDEPIYLREGMERWRTGSLAPLLQLGTMPLPVDVQTLPLYVWETRRGQAFDTVADFDAMLAVARFGNLLFWWALLGYAWMTASALGGRQAGALAVAFLACEPVLAAHAGLATTDVSVTACLLGLVYHFRVGRDSGWWRRIALPAVWFGLAVLAKASGLVFGVLLLNVIEAERCRWWRKPSAESTGGAPRPLFLNSFKDLFQIGALGMAVAFVYCGSDWEPQASWLAWARELPDGPGATIMVWLAEHLRIFSNAGVGIIRQVVHNVRGHGSYVLGHTDERSLWYYFPVVLTIKMSIPLLLAPGLLAIVNWRKKPDAPWYGNWAVLCALALLIFSVTCRVQIGVRFMFPLVVLAVVGLSAVLARTVRDCASLPGRRLLIGATVAGLLWTASAALAVWPNGICYVNPVWGGTENGYLAVSEANYDWGQGLKELARWQRQNHQDDLYVWYYGTDPTLGRLPMRAVPLHTLPIRSADDLLPYVRGHHLAVSTTLAYGSEQASTPPIRAALRRRIPVTRVGTFLIYDFTEDAGLSATRVGSAARPPF